MPRLVGDAWRRAHPNVCKRIFKHAANPRRAEAGELASESKEPPAMEAKMELPAWQLDGPAFSSTARHHSHLPPFSGGISEAVKGRARSGLASPTEQPAAFPSATPTSDLPTLNNQANRLALPQADASKRKADSDTESTSSDRKRMKSSATPEPSFLPPEATTNGTTNGTSASHNAVPFPEKPAVIEERNGDISFCVVNNDGEPSSMIILTGLKCIFQKQLPKMPKDYIARLVYDRTHLSIAIVKRPPVGSYAESSGLPGEVVGGITYRPFKGRQFAEIVFCAISSDQQVKGYGAHLMSHLKDYVKATSDVMHFLTYADNYAIGYFKKQGFTKEITLDRPKWMGYIKDYEGGTIMQCSMLPKIRYLESGRLLLKQKAAVHAKIRAVSKSYEVHQPPAAWRKMKPGQPLQTIDPLTIDAIKATGWSPDMDALARQPRRNPSHSLLLHLLSALQTSSSAWPFLQPVNGEEVQDYYSVIKEPMDLSTIENKLEKDQYDNVEDFIKDALLVVRNCKKYNGETTPYAKAANKLEKEMWKKIREVPEWSYLEPENFETTNKIES